MDLGYRGVYGDTGAAAESDILVGQEALPQLLEQAELVCCQWIGRSRRRFNMRFILGAIGVNRP